MAGPAESIFSYWLQNYPSYCNFIGVSLDFIISNMVRTAIESRREEIVVIKLIVIMIYRRPFLYTGLCMVWGQYFGFNSKLWQNSFSQPCFRVLQN